ncbi:MAG: TM0106 family RecB-like putative nuclease [Actinomycetota bacterium]
MFITASKLYDYINCPHKVWRDIYGPQDEKIEEANPFVKLLWEKGIQHEKKVIEGLGKITDLSRGRIDERYRQTLRHLKKGTPLIYQGVLISGNLLGIPDILKRSEDGLYIPVDIKSGRGFEVATEDGEKGRQKKHYAVQLCLYAEALQKLGFGKNNKGKIIDIEGREVDYFLDEPMSSNNPLTWIDEYRLTLREVEMLVSNRKQNKPALGGDCRLCQWYPSCRKWCEENDDLTLIFYLGRAKRDVINADLNIRKVAEMCSCQVKSALRFKKENKGFLRGVGKGTLDKIVTRANLVKQGIHKIHDTYKFPRVSVELFFDIEDDPTQDFIYLHGVYERSNRGERFISFVARENSPEEEEKAWRNFLSYIRSLPRDDFALYYYSSHERTAYQRLRNKYPQVISREELDSLFANENVIDLYNVVYRNSDWPLWSYSLKDIATYLGFKWRDDTPSGALSIQWYNKYLDTGDKDILKRILEYNEDDCKAAMVIKDFLEKNGRQRDTFKNI